MKVGNLTFGYWKTGYGLSCYQRIIKKPTYYPGVVLKYIGGQQYEVEFIHNIKHFEKSFGKLVIWGTLKKCKKTVDDFLHKMNKLSAFI